MSKRVQDFQSEIPLWIVASMGKSVAIKRQFEGACETYEAGCEGRLTSIQWREDGSFLATVALDPHDPDYWENFAFEDLRPVTAEVQFSLDIDHGFIVF
jgi:hypothetical protein